jgi:hypothetical protein
LTTKQQRTLKDLLLVPKGFARTQLERLRAQPTDLTSVSLAAALNRVESLHALGISNINLDDIAQNRIVPIVRHGLNVWASTLEKYSQARCLTTLLVLFQYLEPSASNFA